MGRGESGAKEDSGERENQEVGGGEEPGQVGFRKNEDERGEMGRKVKDEKSGWMRRSDEKVRMRRLNKKVG